MFAKILDKLRPKISAHEQEMVDSIKSKKTIRSVRGTLYIGAEDVEERMRELHRNTRHLGADANLDSSEYPGRRRERARNQPKG